MEILFYLPTLFSFSFFLSLETTEIVDHCLLGPMDEAIWRQVKVGYLRYDLVRQTSPVTVGRYVNLIAFP